MNTQLLQATEFPDTTVRKGCVFLENAARNTPQQPVRFGQRFIPDTVKLGDRGWLSGVPTPTMPVCVKLALRTWEPTGLIG